MRREYVATVAESQREVEIAVEPVSDEQWRVVVGETERLVNAREVRPGTWSLLMDGRSYIVDLDQRGAHTAVLTSSLETTARIEDARKKRLADAVAAGGQSTRGEVIRAPIAGKVVKVLAEVGDDIEPGTSVAVLEAMKMENELAAERGGVVQTIHVAAEQSVDAGDPLVTLGA